MITQRPTKEMLESWKSVWNEYKDKIKPNRKSGGEIVEYLKSKYVLQMVDDEKMRRGVALSVTENAPFAEKLPKGEKPKPILFLINNVSGNEILFKEEKKETSLWGKDLDAIFVGIDLSSGYFTVEGSSFLWDELCAFQGVDEKDLKNYVCVAQYVNALKRFGKLNIIE